MFQVSFIILQFYKEFMGLFCNGALEVYCSGDFNNAEWIRL
jgi:hypothetical protein